MQDCSNSIANALELLESCTKPSILNLCITGLIWGASAGQREIPLTKASNTENISMSLCCSQNHYGDVIMGAIASQITSLTIVYSTVYSGANQRKHQSAASLAFVWRIHRGPVNSPHKWPVTRKMFPFDDVIMQIFTVQQPESARVYVQKGHASGVWVWPWY